jgi:hypothetical protein
MIAYDHQTMILVFRLFAAQDKQVFGTIILKRKYRCNLKIIALKMLGEMTTFLGAMVTRCQGFFELLLSGIYCPVILRT